jgi:hypothetical protein
MTTNDRSLKTRLETWRLLAAHLRRDLVELPQLERDLAALEGLTAETSALLTETMRLRSELRDATVRLRGLSRRGDMLRTRIGAALRWALGYEHSQLIKYGFRPRRRSRVDERAPAEAAPAPPAPDGPGTEPS